MTGHHSGEVSPRAGRLNRQHCRPEGRFQACFRRKSPDSPSKAPLLASYSGNAHLDILPALRKVKEKAPCFSAGMNPTTPPQPPVLSPLTAYPWGSTTGKTGGWIGVRPDDEGHHTVPARASPRPWRHGRQKATLARLCLPTVARRGGRWHGPCPDAGKPATGGIPAVSPRQTGCTVQADTASEWTPNTPHPSRGRRIAHTPGIASPDPVRKARSCRRGRTTGVLSHGGILALQRGGNVKSETCLQAI